MQYQRTCPECKKEVTYTSPSNFYRAKNGNKLCKSCCRLGKIFSDEHRNNLSKCKVGTKQSMNARLKNSNTQKQRYTNPLVRKKTSEAIKQALHTPHIRQKHIMAMSKNHFLGNMMDVGQLELLEKWNRLGFNFQSNYQVHTDNFLCYIDGYDPIYNIVMEYDSKYHNKPSQKQKDLVRQTTIIDILKPKKFWRYNAVNKHWTNVLDKDTI